jgi:hypothetical protein
MREIQSDKELERPSAGPNAPTSDAIMLASFKQQPIFGRITVSTLACQLDGKHLPKRR